MRVKGFIGAIVWAAALIGQAEAYTLLDFPSQASVEAGSYKRWLLDQASPPILSLSYSIQSDLLGGLSGAQSAALSALDTWDQANTTVQYASTGYQPVVNSLTNWAAGGYYWEGPGAAQGGVGIGANIDIMSRPSGFSFTDPFGKTVTLPSNSLARTATVVLSNNLLSVDIFLNSSYTWSTAGGDFDVETVILHELGHALGLDHPDQAVVKGAANYDPWTHQPGAAWSTTDVMHSGYYPDGLNRTLGNDEIGGLAFLYPGVAGDANLDGAFGFADVQLTIDMFYGSAPGPNPEALHNIDLDHDGILDFTDVDGLITRYFYPDEAAPEGYSVSVLNGMGYDTSGLLPEPHTVLLLAAGACAWRRRGSPASR